MAPEKCLGFVQQIIDSPLSLSSVTSGSVIPAPALLQHLSSHCASSALAPQLCHSPQSFPVTFQLCSVSPKPFPWPAQACHVSSLQPSTALCLFLQHLPPSLNTLRARVHVLGSQANRALIVHSTFSTSEAQAVSLLLSCCPAARSAHRLCSE